MENDVLALIEQKFDSLTGIYERSAMEDFAKKLLAEKHAFSFFLIDGDNFKNVNDRFGHKIGDRVIQIIAEKLKAAFDGKGVVGRFGGDEFYVIMPDVTEYDEVWKACHDALAEFKSVMLPDFPNLSITVTIGLSRAPSDGTTFDELFEKADKALYRGKQKGRSCFIIYLDSKHKNIKVLSSDAPVENSMQRHNTIFSIFSNSPDFKTAISSLMKFFTTNLMIDHVALQGREKLFFSEVYSLSVGKNFSWIDNSLIAPNIEPLTSIFQCNDIALLSPCGQEKLKKELEKQLVISTLFVEISYREKFYGYLRADSTSTFRIWQNCDMDLLLTAAKMLGTALYFQNLTLETID